MYSPLRLLLKVIPPRELFRTALVNKTKKVPCGRWILIRNRHMITNLSEVPEFTCPRNKHQNNIFAYQWNFRARARGSEPQCTAAIYYDPRSMHPTAQSRSEKCIAPDCFIERATPGHLWATYLPSMLNPANNIPVRHPIQGHACGVTGPA